MDNSYVNRDCGPKMSDGRFYTDYRPSAELHSSIRFHNNLVDSNQYRQFLINNAEKMISHNRNFYDTLYGCRSSKCVHVDPNNNDTYWSEYRKMLYGTPSYNLDNKGYQNN